MTCEVPGLKSADDGMVSLGGNFANEEECRQRCLSVAGCESWAFEFSRGDCWYFTAPVEPNFVAEGGSPYVFWDITCSDVFCRWISQLSELNRRIG